MKVLFKLLLTLVFTWIPSQSFAVIDIIHFSKKDVSCPGANDGWLTVDSVTVSAPTAPPYVVRFTSNAGQTFAIGDTIFNLAQQTIIIRINDAGQIFPTNQSVDIDGPDPLLLDLAAIPATCFDTCNGQVFTQVQNGTPPYTYAWNTGSTSSSISGLCDGTYTLLVTDNNGCTISSSEVVTEPNDIIPNVTATNVACNGDATGSATANPIDGVAPLTYSWSSGTSGANNIENGLVQGSYDVTVTDANGCQSIEAFTISEPPVLSTSSSGSDPFCNGEASGFMNVTVNGGTPPHTFTWNDIGVGPQNRTSLVSGTYTVTIEDNNGCARQETQTLTEPAASAVAITGNNIACFGDATGDITVSVTGGTPGQTSFDWSDGSPTTTDNSDPYTSTISGLTEGKYYVTITNAAGCTKIDSLTLTEELELIPSFTNETNPSCNGGSDGSITASAVDGVAPYTFNWPGSPNTNPLSGLNAGSYTVTVVDANGCAKTLTSVLTQPDPIVPTLVPNDVSCNGGSDGSILASAVDGTPPYTFNWAGNPNTNPLTSLMAGTYTVTVVDAGGCTTTSSATISEPASGININLTASNVFCFGTATGGIINNTSGGTSPYTFAWSDGPTSQNRSNIVTGTYTVAVTDFKGCNETESIFVGTVPEIQITMSADSVSCNGLNDGKAWVTYNSGGINPVNNYSWSNGGNTDTISNLTAGRYFVTVSDVTGCAKVDSIDVGEPDQLTIDPPITTDPLCNNSTDGTITINVTGGAPGYAFIWNDNDVSQNRTGLGFGIYTVTVTDKNGCTNSVATTLNNPTLHTVSIDSSENVSCNGLTDGFARALASGGTTPYTYAWQGGPNNASNPSLAAGTYTVVVTDNNGCTATTSQIITEPNAILANASIVQNAQCDGLDNGEVTANATGGTAPYTYFWNPGNINSQTISGLAGGTYTVTVTDGNGCTDEQTLNVSQPSAITFTTDNTDLNCTGDNSGTASVINPQGGTAPYTYLWTPGGSTSQTATGLSAQAYTVLVTDNNGCTNSGSVNISEPTVLSATITNSTNPTCNGINDGTASVTGSGGTVASDYTYLWSPDGETTASITNKAAGTYTVVITDDNGCTDSDQVTLTAPTGVIISNPADTLANVLCVGGNNGYIGVSATGGVQPYTFDWDNIAGTNDGAINANLTAGTYNLTVTDNNGCFETESYTITEPANPFTVSIIEVKQPCAGLSDGELTVTESNGTAPYTYSWTGTTQTTDTVRNLGPGFYLVNVIDANGCVANANFTLTPSIPIVGFTTSIITNVDCFGDSTGSAGAIAFGGTGNLTFTWSTGDVTGSPSVITTLKAGTYTVTVNDDNSCTDSQSITITEPNELDPNTTATNVSCSGTADGSISSTPLGGTPPYQFNWSTGASSVGVSGTISNLTPNIYTLIITDDNGCDTTEAFIIIKETVNYTFRDSIVNESCDGACDGYIEIKDLVGGVAPITYSWSDGSTGPIRSNLCPGNYTVTISDVNGCDSIQNYTITPGIIINPNLSATNASCGANDGFATVTPTGGVAPYTFSWDPATGTAVSTGNVGISSSLAGGSYDVTINDATCSTVVPFTIGSVASFTFDTTVTNINACFGDCNSSIAISNLTGGTTPYTFTWNGVPGANNIQNLCAGNHTLNIADQGGCDTTITFSITEPNELNPNLVVVNANCSGAINGTATSTPSGGGAPYDFEWSTGLIQTAQLTSSITKPAGNYSLTVTDANGCDSIEVFSITSAAAIIVSSNSVSDTCVNSVGRADITSVIGGTSPYTFIWPGNISTTAIANNLTAGTYDVTVEDNSGCQIVESIIVRNFSTFTINAIVDSVSCKNGNDGEIFINTVGGVNPVTYSWAGGVTGGATPKNLTAGTYELTVTDFAGCSEIALIDVEEPDSLTLNISATNESCTPGNDAVAAAFALGGTPSYNFTWSAGVPSGNTTTGLTAGFYTATVTDKYGCEAIGFYDVFSDAPFSVSSTTTKATCNGGTDGSIVLIITGFVPPLTYSWDNSLPPDSTQNNLGAGTYRVTITDATTCSRQTAITVIEESPIAVSIVATDESCSPGNDAYALASVIGGVQPYAYDWLTGTPFNDSVAGLSQGAYNVTVTDANGCSKIEAFTVFSGSDLGGGAVITDATCFGLCDGVIELFPTGGSGSGYTYAWDNGDTTNRRSGLCLGSYRVTITDNSSPPCTRVENLFVTSPSDLTASTFVGSRTESCVPGNDGGIIFFPNGGTGPYTLQTSAGNVSNLGVSGLSSGNYLATITDANGCSLNRPFEILKATPAVITSSFTDAPCNGLNGGSITINAAGGTNPYTYNWTGGLAGNNPGSVGAGTYTVKVADGKGCEAIDTITVGEATKIQANFTFIGESCNPGSDGSATANVTGGTGPYNFDWGAGSTTDNFNLGLNAGNYTVTITDAIGCTEAIPYIINNDAPFNLDSIVNQISCNGANDGSIILSVTGNSGTISYSWDNASVNNSRSPLGDGVYSVTVTDAGTGCTETANFILRDPSIISISNIATDESCRPGNDGTIALTPTGGTTANPGVYTYQWDNSLPANANQVGLSAGTYNVTVFDDNGCSALESITVNPSAPFTIDLDSTDISCFGRTDGRITVNTTANNPSYRWDNGLLPQQNQNNLASGTYCVTVTDDKGCTETDCITINEPSDIIGIVTTTPESCVPGNDGTASVSATGGTVGSPTNYIFSWSTGATGSSISGLSSGSYDVTILDENGCDEVVAFNIGSVAPYTIDLDSTDVSCNGLNDGTITLNTTAINPTFAWNTTSNQNNKDQNNLVAGTYTVTVTEPSSGCTETSSITINEPSILSATVATTPANCNPGNDGTASATGNGGTGPYTFNWSTGETNVNSIGTLTSGNYDVTIVDANGCTEIEQYKVGSSAPFTVDLDSADVTCSGLRNGEINVSTTAINPTFLWNDGSVIQNRTNLSAGTYTVIVTEPSSGCSESATTTVNEPSPINIVVSTSPESCSPGSDGSAAALVSGGSSSSGNYQIDWPNSQTGGSVSGLLAGNYNVTVTDDNGCIEVEPFAIGSVAPFFLDLDSVDVSCFGLADGEINAITISSTGFSFLWSGPFTPIPSTRNISNIIAGTYSVTVTERVTGCTETQSITVNEPLEIIPTINTTPESCNPGNDGGASATAIGGDGNYIFDWSTGDLNTNSVSNLIAGTYTITVTDGTGCSVIQSFNVGSTAPFSVDLDSTDVSCNGFNDGTISLSTTALSATYLWNNGTSTQNQSNLFAGTYDVTVFEPSSGCSETKSIVVNEPTAVSVNVIVTNETCIGNDGTATATGSGGTLGTTGAYSFAWSNGQTGITVNNLTAGSYDVTVTDDNGCTDLEVFSIGVDAPFDVSLDSTNISCNGLADGIISLTTTAINPSFLWNNGLPPQANHINLNAGVYNVTVTEPSSGCSETQSISIVEPDPITITFIKVDDDCAFGNNGSATAIATGGTVVGDYSYLWSTGPTTASIGNLFPFRYRVTVTDDNGCTASERVIIDSAKTIQPNEIVSNETCNGVCDGAIVLNPSNGTGSYTYLWNTGQTTRTRTGLCGGNYLVTITDGLSCDTVVSIDIISNFPLINTVSTTDQGCSSLTVCDGGAVVTTTGGLAPYTYEWPMGTVTGVSSDTAKALCKGNYSVTITDASGCSSVEPFVIGGPDPITATFVTIDPTCNISDGQITVTASGGSSATYTYQWFDVLNNPLLASDTLKNVTAGIYFIAITDNTGCTFRFSTSLSDLGSEVVTLNTTDASCFNTCDGSAIANFNCQDPNCSIEWVNAVTGNTISSGTSNIDNLCSGNYFVRVTNNSGCISIDPFAIGSPDEFQITATITNVSCNLGFDGAISINVTGGAGNYSYNWSPGPITGQSSPSVSGLIAGTYNVTVSDVNLCDTVLNFQVGEPTEIMATFSSVDANCNQSNGQIIANVTGGTIVFDYDYQWFDALSNPILGQTSPSITGLSTGKGNYFLRVRDANSCEKVFISTVGSTNGPTILVDSVRDLTCFDDNTGAIFTTASGANGPFTYNWLPQGQTNSDVLNLTAGTYTIGVTNSLGCTTFDTVTVNGPLELLATLNISEASCGLCNGEVRITPSGGNAPYTYLWSNGSTADSAMNLCGGSYSMVLSDASGCSKSFNFAVNTNGGPTGETVSATNASCASNCDGSATVTPIGGIAPYTYLWLHNGATSNSLNNLCPGNYTLQVSDVKGCSRSVNIDILSPSAMSLTSTITAQTCNSIPCDGSIRIDMSGGTSPYSYDWGPGSLPATSNQSGLCAGIYNLTVTDANGCTIERDLTLNNSGVPLSIAPTVEDVNCYGSCDGSLISNITILTDYNFQWFNNQGTAISPINGDLTNSVCAGEYFLEITSLVSGCKSFENVTVGEPDSISLASSIVKNISCNGACDGEIFVSTIGGNILYQYSWDDPNGQDGVPAKDLCAGTYGVTATDANGCTETTSVTLIDPPILNLSIDNFTNVGCSSDCEGTANVSGNGGTAPYTFEWSGGQIGANPLDLCFGQNIITITDATGCSIMDTINISATDTVLAIVPNQILYCGTDPINLIGETQGSSVNSVAWYIGDPSSFFTNNLDTSISRPFGSYSFFLIASNGSCSDTTEYSFEVAPKPFVGLAPSIAIFKDEIALFRLSNQNQSYTYSWTPGSFLNDSNIAEPLASPRENVLYTVTVTDTTGCTYADSIQVLYTKDIEIPSGISPNGDGVNDTWEIDFLEDFPNASVLIYNRWGTLLYEQKNGYQATWDGTFEGKALPIGTYYYVIDLKSDRFEPLTGPITIVK